MIKCVHISKYNSYLDIVQLDQTNLHNIYNNEYIMSDVSNNNKVLLNITENEINNAINKPFINYTDFQNWFVMIYNYIKILNDSQDIIIIYKNKEQLYTILYSYIKCNNNIEVDIRVLNNLKQYVKNEYGKYIKKLNEILNNKVVITY